MRSHHRFDLMTSVYAVIADAVAVYMGFMLARWVRFESGWIPLFRDAMPPMRMYFVGSAVATLVFLVVYWSVGLFTRPQLGTFPEKIPRLVRATGLGILLIPTLTFIFRTDPPVSRTMVMLSFFTVTVLVLIERYVIFRLELHYAKHHPAVDRVLVIGADALALRLKHALRREPRLHARVEGFIRSRETPPDPDLPADALRGGLDVIEAVLDGGDFQRVILADAGLPHARIVDLIVQCERRLIRFNMVPDLFRVMTSRMSVETLEGIPLLGLDRWPLDHAWNRIAKRAEDLAGAVLGLALTWPLMAAAAMLIRRESPGPALYRQERCGEYGRTFTMYKLRTMRKDAEQASGPVWTSPDDPRRTRVGAWLRRWNLDELPQLWNVLRGDMSLVGPRPERPFFVEQFRGDILRYMSRHVCRPGMTGWAQINGLRGQTDVRERIQHDLYYLENWSLAFDFKILAKTLFARTNAY